MSKGEAKHEKLWQQFSEKESLTAAQRAQFERYCEMLLSENENINLTAITSVAGVIRHHFQDSLALGHFHDMSTVKVMADVGTGAGFPALALKIKYPHLNVLLIDMNKKKQRFLQNVCDELALSDVQIAEYDWRTFIRITQGEIDLFTARASLSPKELARMFKPSCSYNASQLVYWASETWEPEAAVTGLIRETWEYKNGLRPRKLVLMSRDVSDR